MFYFVKRRFPWRMDYIVETESTGDAVIEKETDASSSPFVLILASSRPRYQHIYPAIKPFKDYLSRYNLSACKVEGYYTAIPVTDFPLYLSSMRWISCRLEDIMKGVVCI